MGSIHAVGSAISRGPGDGSGRSGEKARGAEVGDNSGRSGEKVRSAEVGDDDGVVCVDLSLALSLYHSAGALQEAMPKFFSGEPSERSSDGAVGLLSTSEVARLHSAGVNGRALSVSVGCGGAVWMNDLNERTERSIPSREADEIFLCLKYACIWLSWLQFLPLGSRAAQDEIVPHHGGLPEDRCT
jgi:hypothetical protein